MDSLHKYVPTVKSTKMVTVPGCAQPRKLSYHRFHHILVGGDQVTAVRALSSQKVRRNSKTLLDQLQGITPVCEDWHARVVLLQVSVQHQFANN